MIPYFRGSLPQLQAVVSKLGIDWMVYCVDGNSSVWRAYVIHGTVNIWFDFTVLPQEADVLTAFSGKAFKVDFIQCSEQGMIEGLYQIPFPQRP